jgi:protein-tyrosine-phosphatase
MAGAALEALGGCEVGTAGTFVVEGQPISWRTREALAGHGLVAHAHRSRQLAAGHLEDADLVVALAVEHVEWVRREHPGAAHKTATLKRLVRDGVGSGPWHGVELDPTWEDVADPGGGELPDFVACADEIVPLVRRLHEVLTTRQLYIA